MNPIGILKTIFHSYDYIFVQCCPVTG